jgi:hypothetical protein
VSATGPEPNVEFTQSGYQMRVQSAHSGVTLHYTHPSDESASGTVKLERGMNSVCLKRAGKRGEEKRREENRREQKRTEENRREEREEKRRVEEREQIERYGASFFLPSFPHTFS